MRKFSLIFVLLLTLFSLFLRLYRVEEPDYYYFDEVYHAVTAKAYADNNPDAYNPFAPAPKEGTAYDWLHPPLAKLIQAGSIKLLGDGPLGWRLPSVIFGTAIIPATFFFSLILFGPLVAVFASIVIAFENLTFVMSRITMNDVFLTFFVLCSFTSVTYYLKSHKRIFLFITALFLGLAVSSKWTGAYALALVFASVVFTQIKNRKFSPDVIILLIIPIMVYFASYTQFWLQGHTAQDFIDLHKQIWWYQNRHDLKHTYGTTPLYCVPEGLDGPRNLCPWALNSRGVYFSYEEYGDGLVGYIYALGNPLIFWGGVIAVSYLLGKLIDERGSSRNYKLLLVLSAYLVFWVPWIFSPRIMFLYHYLPSLPFLAVLLGIALGDIYNSRLRYLSIIILILFVAAFVYLYPISSGWPIETNSIEKFMLIKTWR